MNLWKLIIAAFGFVQPAADAQEVELLSKKDTQAVFAMTRAHWISNVVNSVAAGQAKAMGTPVSGLSMVTTTPQAHLIVKPDYTSSEQRPDFVQVTVAYLDPKVSVVMKDAVLRSAIESAEKQLAPEFNVIANFEQIQNRLVIYFMIYRKERE